MDENRDIEKVTRSLFEKMEMDAGDRAWERLDADLDKRQAAMYKQKAGRFKLLSAALAFFLFSIITCHYYNTTTDIKSTGVTAEQLKLQALQNPTVKEILPADFSPGENAAASVNKNISASQNINSSERIISYQPVITGKSSVNKNIIAAKSEPFSQQQKMITSETVFNSTGETGNAEQVSEANPLNNIAITGEVDTLTDHAFQEIDDVEIASAFLEKNDTLISTEKNSVHRFSIAAYYAPTYSINQLTDNTPDDFDDVTMYHNREQQKFSYATGLLLHYDLSARWSLGAGISYSQTRYSIDLPVMYASYNTKNELHYRYPTANGIVDMPSEKLPPIQEGDSMLMNHNATQSIKYLNMPLLIRHQTTINKFMFFAEAGISPTLVLQEKLTMQIGNETSTVVDHIEGLQKLNFGFVAGVGAQFNIRPDFGIFAEPVFKASLNSITQNTAVNSYQHILGVNIGASIRF